MRCFIAVVDIEAQGGISFNKVIFFQSMSLPVKIKLTSYDLIA